MKEIKCRTVLVVLTCKWYFCLMGAALKIPESKESVANAKKVDTRCTCLPRVETSISSWDMQRFIARIYDLSSTSIETWK
mgnify:CR=1 FL=1